MRNLFRKPLPLLAPLSGLLLLSVWETGFRKATVEPRPAQKALFVPGDRPIAIVRSEASDRCIGAKDFAQHATRWQTLLHGAGYATEIIGDTRIEAGLDSYAATVLPSVVCLGDAARRELERYVRSGGGVVATWALGARDAKGLWRGYDFLQLLTGAVRFELGRNAAPWFVSVTTSSPLGAGLVGGTRMQVTSEERLEATALEGDGFWSDARLSPRDPTLPADYQVAVVRRRLDLGRMVWLGFHESSAVTGEAERASALLLNGVAWAARRPLLAIEPWPAPFARSVLVAVDIGEYPDRARRLAVQLAEARVPATFFLDTTLAHDRDLVKALEAAGEVALKWRPSEEGRWARRFRDRLRLGWARLSLGTRSWTWARGVRPFGDTLDAAGSETLAEAGVGYFLAAGGVDSVLPKASSVRRPPAGLFGEGSIVGLGRSTDDDLHLSPFGLEGLNAAWIADRIVDDGESVGRLGGLYVLSLHTQGLGAPEYLPAIRKSLAGISTPGTWLARGREIALWWAARSRVRLGLSSPSPSSLRIEVSGDPSKEVENLVLVIYPGALRGTPRVTSSAAGQPPVIQVDADPKSDRLRLTVPRLDRSRAVTLEVTFDR